MGKAKSTAKRQPPDAEVNALRASLRRSLRDAAARRLVEYNPSTDTIIAPGIKPGTDADFRASLRRSLDDIRAGRFVEVKKGDVTSAPPKTAATARRGRKSSR
jgi:hypothetical protein